MNEIRIKTHDGISDLYAMDLVRSVILGGKISKRRGVEQYCFVTIFNTKDYGRVSVECRQGATTLFDIRKDEERD